MLQYYFNKTSWLGGRYGLLFLAMTVCLLFTGIWTYQILQGREAAITLAQANTANLVRIIEAANNRTIQAIDLTLGNVETIVKRNGWNTSHDTNASLRSLLREAPQVREVAFADSSGRVISTSRSDISTAVHIREEAYFKKASEGSLPPLFISTPRPGRLLGDSATEGQWHLIMCHTVFNDGGDFAGVALAVINPGFFHELIQALDVGDNGYVAYYRYDGKLLMSSTSSAMQLSEDKNVNELLFGRYLPKKEWGTFIEKHKGENSHTYIISYRATSRWPLLVAVGLNQDEVLKPWRAETLDFSILMAGSLVVLLLLAIVVYKQQLLQEKMSIKLVEAHHDALTGIPSLRLCLDRLTNALTRATRENEMLAVFFIDLDGFKAINDTHGHEAGDYVLQQVAVRLSSCVRQMDTVGRLGGDEFLMILPKIKDVSILEKIGRKVVRSVNKPIHWKKENLLVSASVGITIHPGDGNEADQLIKNADIAMYAAKKSGKNRCTLYEHIDRA